VAPQVEWTSPAFHPNIGVAGTGTRDEVRVLCLGVLQTHYQPALDLQYLCQMIIEVARCRNYALPEQLDPESPGILNAEALEWYLAPEGQRAIASIGGRTLRELLPDRYGPPQRRPIRIRPIG
jgi:hypothetical protein